MNKDNQWEDISNNSDRLRVPGGWIVRSWDAISGSGFHQVFISDPSHSWELL